MNRRTVLVLAMVVFRQTLVVAGDTAVFFGLGHLEGGYSSSSAYGVSRDGLAVVGRSKSASGTESFRWTADDGMIGLGDLDGGAFFGTAVAASAGGAVVAGHSKSSPGYDEEGDEAFRWTEADGMVGLGTLGGSHLYSGAHGISADGSTIVGWSGLQHEQGREAFLWTAAGGMVGLGDLDGGDFFSYATDVSADGSVVVGASKSVLGVDSREAFRWTTDDGMTGLGRLQGDSRANAVSADGSVVVGSSGTDWRREAFRWTKQSGMVGLGDLPGNSFYSNAFGVSADGSVVVGRCESQTGTEAFIWDAQHGMRSLKDVLTNVYGLDLGDWRLTCATGISDDGRTIVGYGFPPPINNPEAWIVILPDPKVVYVDVDAAGANDGSSWKNAFSGYFGLQSALAVAAPGDEIRVAQGIYKPDITNGIIPPSRSAAFHLKHGVKIKGGYAGFGEPNPDARNIDLYETILTGDLNGDDRPDLENRTDNSYHVVVAGDIDADAVLDGFTVTGGNANDSSRPNNRGGGIYCAGEATISNCTFTENSAVYGGGMACLPTSCCVTSPTLDNCTFIDNSAEDGGGMFISDSDPEMTQCVFIDNTASNDGGAMMYYMDSIPILNNCLFSGNRAAHDGGGIFLLFAFNIDITNSTFGYNSAGNLGGGIYQSEVSTDMEINNSILWGNTDIGGANETAQVYSYYGGLRAHHSCIQGWTGSFDGTANHGDDPLFANPRINDLHLQSQAGRYDPAAGDWVIDAVTSSCIDTGAAADPIGYEPFPNGGTINMGAYGGTKQASKSYFGTAPCEIITAGDINGDCRVDLLDFVIMAGHWLWEE